MRDIRTETAELYARYADMLYRTAYARLLNAADAEDATVAGYLPPQSSEVMVQGGNLCEISSQNARIPR